MYTHKYSWHLCISKTMRISNAKSKCCSKCLIRTVHDWQPQTTRACVGLGELRMNPIFFHVVEKLQRWMRSQADGRNAPHSCREEHEVWQSQCTVTSWKRTNSSTFSQYWYPPTCYSCLCWQQYNYLSKQSHVLTSVPQMRVGSHVCCEGCVTDVF